MGRHSKAFSRVIPIHARLKERIEKKQSGKSAYGDDQANHFFTDTLDLLIDDFGKKHRVENCVLCEPMRLLGKHRDEVVLELTLALFTLFFPSFEGYVQDIRESLLQNLLDRRRRGGHSTWKEKLKGLLLQQVELDLRDFFEDIQKHLMKFAQTAIDEDRKERILNIALRRLEEEWMESLRPSHQKLD